MIGMLGEFFKVKVQSQPRTIWNSNEPVHHFDGVGHQLRLPRDIEIVKNFLDQKIGGAGD